MSEIVYRELKKWVVGGFYYSEEWFDFFYRYRKELVPSRTEKLLLYRAAYSGFEQYTRCTSWTTRPCIAATYGGPDRVFVSWKFSISEIAAVIPDNMFDYNQSEVVVFPLGVGIDV
jgi:hypothetical protein